MGVIDVFMNITVKDKKGKVVDKRRVKCNSFVKNFLLLLNAGFRKTGVAVVDIDGTSVTSGVKGVWRNWCNNGFGDKTWCNSGSMTFGRYGLLLVGAGAKDSSYGIIVGSGTTPVSPDDYKLENQIAHGTADGQLYYGDTDVLDVVVQENKIIQGLQRQFTNQGAVDVEINEIGVVVKTTENNYKVLIIRDVLDTPVTIPSGGTVVIQIDIVAIV